MLKDMPNVNLVTTAQGSHCAHYEGWNACLLRPDISEKMLLWSTCITFGGWILSMSEKRLSVFERYLTIWVALCIAAGILLGKMAPEVATTLNDLSIHQVLITLFLELVNFLRNSQLMKNKMIFMRKLTKLLKKLRMRKNKHIYLS